MECNVRAVFDQADFDQAVACAMICSVMLRGTGWTRPGLANCFDSITNVTTRDGERKKKVRHEDGQCVLIELARTK